MTEQPTTPAPLTVEEAATEARRLIRDAYRPGPGVPAVTSWRDTTPTPTHGTAAPVPQPDRRIVPEWAAGVAVASIGLGCGAALVGAGLYAATAGLAQVTLAGVLLASVPFLGAGLVAIAIGTAIRAARTAAPPMSHHHYEGHVTQHTKIETGARGMFSRTTISR
ncbi:hypothetical protein [Streptomyces bohaiensis]|uniref:hypothetical protein n=1 Tax=Streptomyces bohaiensis TaxID=1431344 RepID=UPI003B76ECE1